MHFSVLSGLFKVVYYGFFNKGTESEKWQHFSMNWLQPCYCAEASRSDFAGLPTTQAEMIITVKPLQAVFNEGEASLQENK